MPFENFVADWLTIVESNISAVPAGGTGGAGPAFTTNFDFLSVLEPDGATMGVNNQVTRTSTGWDLAGVSDGTVGYDRMHRVFGAPTFGNGLGNFLFEWEYAYWDGMARGTTYPIMSLANDTAPPYYNGAGKGNTPNPIRTAATGTQDSGWDVMVDDSGGMWFGTDGSIAVQDINATPPFDLVGAGMPARVDGTNYFCELAWNDTTKILTYTEYTDATRAVAVAVVDLTAQIIATSTFTTLVATTNENQIKTAFSGRDQQSVFKNLNLNMVTGPIANASGTLVLSGSAAGSVETPVVRYFGTTVFSGDGTVALNGVTCYLMELDGSKAPSHLAGQVTVNHPVGHPTQAGNPGWVVFNHTDLLAAQVNHFIMVLDQAGTTGVESGVSVEIAPQLTNDGNG